MIGWERACWTDFSSLERHGLSVIYTCLALKSHRFGLVITFLKLADLKSPATIPED